MTVRGLSVQGQRHAVLVGAMQLDTNVFIFASFIKLIMCLTFSASDSSSTMTVRSHIGGCRESARVVED